MDFVLLERICSIVRSRTRDRIDSSVFLSTLPSKTCKRCIALFCSVKVDRASCGSRVHALVMSFLESWQCSGGVGFPGAGAGSKRAALGKSFGFKLCMLRKCRNIFAQLCLHNTTTVRPNGYLKCASNILRILIIQQQKSILLKEKG